MQSAVTSRTESQELSPINRGPVSGTLTNQSRTSLRNSHQTIADRSQELSPINRGPVSGTLTNQSRTDLRNSYQSIAHQSQELSPINRGPNLRNSYQSIAHQSQELSPHQSRASVPGSSHHSVTDPAPGSSSDPKTIWPRGLGVSIKSLRLY
jgi:hypothetical protein